MDIRRHFLDLDLLQSRRYITSTVTHVLTVLLPNAMRVLVFYLFKSTVTSPEGKVYFLPSLLNSEGADKTEVDRI